MSTSASAGCSVRLDGNAETLEIGSVAGEDSLVADARDGRNHRIYLADTAVAAGLRVGPGEQFARPPRDVLVLFDDGYTRSEFRTRRRSDSSPNAAP